MTNQFAVIQPTKAFPQIYVYEDKKDPGWFKVGYTTRKNAEDRIREQFNTPYNVILTLISIIM